MTNPETTALLARLDAGTSDTRAAAGLIREFLAIPTGYLRNAEMRRIDRGFVFDPESGDHGFAAPVGMDCMFSLHFVAGRSFLVPHLDGMAIMPKEYHHQVVARAEQAEARVAALEAQLAALTPLQSRVAPWMQACFGPEVSADRLERGDRLLEEVFELLQSGDYPQARVVALRDYVWSRQVGDPAQEVGGVMITLAAYCLAHGLKMHEAGETELARIWTKVEAIRAKQAAKPKGSALPQEWPTALTPPDAELDALFRRACELVCHDQDCPSIGGNGDDDCECDAVPFLTDFEAALRARKGGAA